MSSDEIEQIIKKLRKYELLMVASERFLCIFRGTDFTKIRKTQA
jgi:hypothetical protein